MSAILSFILLVMIVLCGTVVLILVLSKHNNIKQLYFHISINNGIEVKSLFYKEK